MAMGERGKPLLDLADSISHMMLNITGYVMKIAPIAVCASVASVITKSGPGILLNFAKFLGGFYLTLLILWVILLSVGFLVIGGRMGELVRRMREPFLLAFSTASSEASYPKILEQLERLASPSGSPALSCPSAIPSISTARWPTRHSPPCSLQAYGSTCRSKQLLMAATLVITSKGVAGVLRASLVVILATLKQFACLRPDCSDPRHRSVSTWVAARPCIGNCRRLRCR